MPEKWTGELVGRMHNERVTGEMLAIKLGVTKSWVSMVLNGARCPKDAEQKFNAAVDEIIAEHEKGE